MDSHSHPIKSLHKDQMYKILAESDLGAGNFLYKTLSHSTHHNVPFVFTEIPYTSLVHGTQSEFSLSSLKREVDIWAKFYVAQNIAAKDVVGVYTRDTIEYLIHYIALTSLGAIPALVNSLLSPKITAQYFDDIGAKIVVADEVRASEIMGNKVDSHAFGLVNLDTVTQQDLSSELPEVYPFKHFELDPVLLTHTSGTTGIPKSVISCHKNYLHGVIHRLKNPKSNLDKYMTALPHSHNSGIAYLMEAIIRGCEVYIKSNKHPESMAADIESFQPNFVVAFPKIFVDLCRANIHEGKLRSVNYWRSTGDAAHEAHVRIITQWGSHIENGMAQPGSVYIDGLGSSEMGSSLFVVLHNQHKRNYNRVVGKPQPWVEAKVLDEWGNELPDETVGRLGVKSPSLTLGYWNNSSVSEKYRCNGYWITGDLVYKTKLGQICHVDRITDAIHLKDRTVYSLLTEEMVMKNIPVIFDCSVFQSEYEGSASANIKVRLWGDVSADKDDLLSKVNLSLKKEGLAPLDALDFYSDDVPEGVTGKVLKRALRAAV